MSIKIFCIYHRPFEVFKTDVIEPIQTGCYFSDLDLGFLKDNLGENIADKNKNFGELTAWYNIWKNYLNQNQEVEYLGFCHYRRFLDFEHSSNLPPFSNKISADKFKKIFNKKYSSNYIQNFIKDYDVILPSKRKLKRKNETIYSQFVDVHPKIDMDKTIDIIKKFYPEYVQDLNDVLNDNEAYYCLNFVMKRELFSGFMSWIFDILLKLDKQSDWCSYQSYEDIRTPAYIAERLINVWIRHQIRTKNIKVLERNSLFICDYMFKPFPGISIVRTNNDLNIKFFGIRYKKILK